MVADMTLTLSAMPLVSIVPHEQADVEIIKTPGSQILDLYLKILKQYNAYTLETFR